MYSTIATADAVRTAGGFAPGGEGAAGPTNEQFEAALQPARLLLVDRIGAADYDTIRGITPSDETDDGIKRKAFEIAECFFAIANLAAFLTLAQLEASGVKRTIEIGKAITTFDDSLREVAAVYFINEGWKVLADYVPFDLLDEDDEQFGVDTGGLSLFTV